MDAAFLSRARARSTWSGTATAHGGKGEPFSTWWTLWQSPCYYCDRTAKGVDLIVPKVVGGRNIARNLRPACRWDSARVAGRRIPR